MLNKGYSISFHNEKFFIRRNNIEVAYGKMHKNLFYLIRKIQSTNSLQCIQENSNTSDNEYIYATSQEAKLWIIDTGSTFNFCSERNKFASINPISER